MARGKYASRAEASKARETAQQEAASLRRENERMAKDLAETSEALATERAQYASRIADLNAQIAEGSSDQVASLQAELLNHRRAEVERVKARGVAVWRILTKYQVRLPPAVWDDLADALGCKSGELYDAVGLAGNRHAKRSRNTKLKQMVEARMMADTIGRQVP